MTEEESAVALFENAVPDDAGVSQATARAQEERALVLREDLAPAENGLGLPSIYAGASLTPATPEQSSILESDVAPEDLDILPTGEVYPSQSMIRRLLNKAFQPLGWALVALDRPMLDQKKNLMYQHWALYIGGRFASDAWGEQEYELGSHDMSWPTAIESSKSIALKRCAKDLGVSLRCWDRRFCDEWRDTYAVEVWCTGVAAGNKGNRKPLWRRKDAKPFRFPWKEEEERPGTNGQKITMPQERPTTPAAARPPAAVAPAAAAPPSITSPPIASPGASQAPKTSPVTPQFVDLVGIRLLERKEKAGTGFVRTAYRTDKGFIVYTFEQGPDTLVAKLDEIHREEAPVSLRCEPENAKFGYRVVDVL